MSISTAAPAGPIRSNLSVWIQAARPKTLSASIVPVGVGSALAYGRGEGRAPAALAALAGAVLIQVGTNFINDYYDFKRGADTAERLGPVRVTQSGLMAPRVVLASGLFCFLGALLLGVYLVAVGGWPIVLIGLAALACGYAYTGGPWPLGYLGLGDVLVFAFFGFVAVGGTYYVQAGHLTSQVWLASLPMGAIATAILAVNNLRDQITDAKAGKRTVVVRWGLRGGREEYAALLILAYLAPLVMWLSGLARAWVLLPLISAPLAVQYIHRVFTRQGADLNPLLGETARLEAIFGALFSGGLLLS
jgi:1,4-dihydroxy-2-naphthoate octaprenyltransferase